MLLLVAAIATHTALDLVPVTAPGSHMVSLATLGALPHCVTSGRETIHYEPVTRVVICVLARGRPRCVTVCDVSCVRLRFVCAPVPWVVFCVLARGRPRCDTACVPSCARLWFVICVPFSCIAVCSPSRNVGVTRRESRRVLGCLSVFFALRLGRAKFVSILSTPPRDRCDWLCSPLPIAPGRDRATVTRCPQWQPLLLTWPSLSVAELSP